MRLSAPLPARSPLPLAPQTSSLPSPAPPRPPGRQAAARPQGTLLQGSATHRCCSAARRAQRRFVDRLCGTAVGPRPPLQAARRAQRAARDAQGAPLPPRPPSYLAPQGRFSTLAPSPPPPPLGPTASLPAAAGEPEPDRLLALLQGHHAPPPDGGGEAAQAGARARVRGGARAAAAAALHARPPASRSRGGELAARVSPAAPLSSLRLQQIEEDNADLRRRVMALEGSLNRPHLLLHNTKPLSSEHTHPRPLSLRPSLSPPLSHSALPSLRPLPTCRQRRRGGARHEAAGRGLASRPEGEAGRRESWAPEARGWLVRRGASPARALPSCCPPRCSECVVRTCRLRVELSGSLR